MQGDDFWQLFEDTGDPICWLMSRDKGQESSARRAEAESQDGGEPS